MITGVNAKIPDITIDYDKNCSKCGKPGAIGKACLCLSCVGKIIEKKWKEKENGVN